MKRGKGFEKTFLQGRHTTGQQAQERRSRETQTTSTIDPYSTLSRMVGTLLNREYETETVMTCQSVALNMRQRAQHTCHRQTAAPAGPGSDGPQGKWGTVSSLRVYRVLPCLFFSFSFNSKKSIPKSLRDKRRPCRPHRLQQKHTLFLFSFLFPFLPPSLLLFFSQLPLMAKTFKHKRVDRTVIRAALLLPLEPIAGNSFSWLLYLACYSPRCNSHATNFTL